MTKIRKDILWKGILEDLFEHFLTYFYPNSPEIFDFSKGFEFLDKELEQITIPARSKHRFTDKLVKVYTKEGEEKWVLIHIEVQGYEDDLFSKRMFAYHYRIYDKYDKTIAAFALFTDNNPNYRPNTFESELLDTKILYQYGTFKLSDYKPEDFQKSNNPFAIVLETAWYALKQNKLSDENHFALKLDLARRLQKRGFSKKIFAKMCNFIKYYVSFANTELLPKLVDEIDTITKTAKPMGIIEAIEQEIIRQTTVKTERRVTKEVTQQILSDNINKLYRKGFTVESIAEMLEVPLKFVKKAVA
jgi:SOS response regulatory protein OraA/RecX